MIRTVFVAFALVLAPAPPPAAQDPGPAADAKVQADPIDELVAAMRAAEGRLRSVVLELTAAARLPTGLTVTTRGALRVVRGAQPAVHTSFAWELDDGLRGRSVCAQTATGIVMLEEDAAFGEVFVHVEPAIVADLEWAGAVLRRDDLPGMAPLPPDTDGQPAAAPRHADAPLGSAMVAAMQRQFVLATDARTVRDGEQGTWLTGARRGGLDVQGGLPVADRVELFVRAQDHALLSLRQFVGEQVVQELTVTKVVPDAALTAADFEVRGAAVARKPVQEHRPMWEQIQAAIRDAEARSAEGVVRPSRR